MRMLLCACRLHARQSSSPSSGLTAPAGVVGGAVEDRERNAFTYSTRGNGGGRTYLVVQRREHHTAPYAGGSAAVPRPTGVTVQNCTACTLKCTARVHRTLWPGSIGWHFEENHRSIHRRGSSEPPCPYRNTLLTIRQSPPLAPAACASWIPCTDSGHDITAKQNEQACALTLHFTNLNTSSPYCSSWVQASI